jgi:C4-dicarboxylate-specific signal transduction histidine kinase
MRRFKKASEFSGDRLDPLALVETNTKRMMNIINHLRIFSRQATEGFTIVDVNKTIKGCCLSYGIVKDHQGEIGVAETGPEGTTFRMRFPIIA